MDKGRLVVEFEKNGDELKFTTTEIRNLTVEELANLVGALLNIVISNESNNKVEQVFWKAGTLRDICSQMGLESTADKLDKQIENWGAREEGK